MIVVCIFFILTTNISFSGELEAAMNESINYLIRENNGRGRFVVNPYWIPSKIETVRKFFNQLGSISRLAMFSLNCPDERYEDSSKKCLYDFISGPPNEEKK